MSRKKTILLTVIGLLAVAYFFAYIIPTYLKNSPKITGISLTTIENEGSGKVVNITGDGLSGAYAVYINGEWNVDCIILEKDNDHVVVKIPKEIRKTPGTYDFKLQVKINSDIERFSNVLPLVIEGSEGK